VAERAKDAHLHDSITVVLSCRVLRRGITTRLMIIEKLAVEDMLALAAYAASLTP